MKEKILMLLLLTAALSGFAQSEADKKEILTILNRQETDWNRGDVASFMVGYWESDSLSFTGSKGITYGYRAVFERYRHTYPDKTAMGELHFEIKEFFFLADGVAQMIGKFSLLRAEGENAEGYFTLIWRKIDGRWVITSDHTSG